MKLPHTYIAVPTEDGVDVRCDDEIIEENVYLTDASYAHWLDAETDKPLDQITEPTQVVPQSTYAGGATVTVQITTRTEVPAVARQIAESMLQTGYRWDRAAGGVNGVDEYQIIEETEPDSPETNPDIASNDGGENADMLIFDDPDEKVIERMNETVHDAYSRRASTANNDCDWVNALRVLGWTDQEILSAARGED